MDASTPSRADDAKHFLKVSRQLDPYGFLCPDEDSSLFKPSFVQRALSIPFAPKWAFGVDFSTKFINLTTNKENYKLFYVVSHVGIIYSHATNDMQFLMGHRNLIASLSTDESGKWLVTADGDKDNSIIVWDSDDSFPVRTIFDPHPDVGVKKIAISHDAKFLVSVGAEPDPVIKFWLWTYGNDEVDGIFTAKSSYGDVKNISFNPNECTQFAVTFSTAVIFLTWASKELTYKIAEIPYSRAKNYGLYTNTTYIPYSHECLTVTTNGWVIVWGLTFFTVAYDSMPDNNNKLFIKAIRLQRDGINFIQYVDGVICTTDYRGNIRFYDEKLKILYFCHKFSLPNIIMTAFNLGQRKFIVQDPTVLDSDRNQTPVEKVEEKQEIIGETEENQEIIGEAEENQEIIGETEENLEIINKTEEIQETEFKAEQTEDNDEEAELIFNVEIENLDEQEIKEETGSPQQDHEPDDDDDGDTGAPKINSSAIDRIESFPLITEEVQQLDELQIYIKEEEIDEKQEIIYEYDKSEEFEKIYLNLLPSDFTLQRAPFLVRDYIILTMDGEFAYVDAIENKLDFFLTANYSPVTSMDVHSERKILILGYANGCVYTYNYDECRLIVKRTIMNSRYQENNVISCIRFSPEGLFLACGTGGGHLWFLDPITIRPVKPYDKRPFKYETSKILDIVFSFDNHYVAYYDTNMGVSLLKRNDIEDQRPGWVFHGRVIAHTKDITKMLFCSTHRLFSVSKDRCMVEYDVKDSSPGKLQIISRIPIMQRGYPETFITYDLLCEEGIMYFLVSTNEYKYLIINEQSSTLERTILAPFFGEPVKELEIIPDNSSKYILFSSGKYLGIQMLPISGNPYKQVTLIAHSNHIDHFRVCKTGKLVFTYGTNDNVCLMWNIRSESVEYMFEQGGRQLSPYYSLIEGGSEGWLFQEMKDLFYYMQILHQGEDSPFPRQVSDNIPISELPNLMRAVGYFPTEFELDNIIYEVKYHYVESTNEEEEEEINFQNFVKLYINHRPVRSFNKHEVKWAFQRLAVDGVIPRQQFIDILCNKGEPFISVSLQHCLSILSHNIDGELLPENLTYEYFMSEILGVENNEFF